MTGLIILVAVGWLITLVAWWARDRKYTQKEDGQ